MPQPASPSVTPSTDEYAERFFTEAVRHLEDAVVLHGSRRWAAVASAMKAAELSVKSVLILRGAFGHWDKLFQTHKPLVEIDTHPFFKLLNTQLDQSRSGLSRDVREMERLEPTTYNIAAIGTPNRRDENPEYPFLVDGNAGTLNNPAAVIVLPSQFFQESQSKESVNLARELLTTLTDLHPTMQAWGLTLPAAV